MKEERSYYAIIPANVRYDSRLTPNAKLLYGEITALCNEKGYCWASNQYFSDLYSKSKVSISTWISQLVKFGYIDIELFYKNGTKEIDRRVLKISYTPPLRKLKYPIKENLKGGIKENLKDNNTLTNTTINSIDVSVKTEPLFPELHIDRKRKSLFRNSDLKKEGIIEKELSKEIEVGVDVQSYIDSVERWSDINTGKKRDLKGWVATIRNFMVSDKKKGKLQMLNSREDDNSLLDGLNV